MFEEDDDEFFKSDGRKEELVISFGCPLIVYKSNAECNFNKNEMYSVNSFDDDLITLNNGMSFDYSFIVSFLNSYLSYQPYLHLNID